MDLRRALSFINEYFLWLLAASLLFLLLTLREVRESRRDRAETIFSLEKEMANAREKRARRWVVVAALVLLALLWLRFMVVPSQPLPPLQEPTPTRFVIEVPTPTPVTPTPTMTRIPTRPRPTAAPPTETPTPIRAAPAYCPLPGVRITSPAMDEAVAGQVTIRGTANIDAFQFYKVEYGMGEETPQWNSIGDIVRRPVVDGVLATWNLAGFPNGVYRVRLTVVDITGNFPPPCEVRVVVQQ